MDNQIKLARALEDLQAGRNAEAQKILVEIVKEDPNNADAWFALSSCFDDHEKKLFLVNKALSIDPDHPEANLALIALLGMDEETKPAIEVDEAPAAEVELPPEVEELADELPRAEEQPAIIGDLADMPPQDEEVPAFSEEVGEQPPVAEDEPLIPPQTGDLPPRVVELPSELVQPVEEDVSVEDIEPAIFGDLDDLPPADVLEPEEIEDLDLPAAEAVSPAIIGDLDDLPPRDVELPADAPAEADDSHLDEIAAAGAIAAAGVAGAAAFISDEASSELPDAFLPDDQAAPSLDPWDIPTEAEPQEPKTETYPWELPPDGEPAQQAKEEPLASTDIPDEGVPIAEGETAEEIARKSVEKAARTPTGKKLSWWEVWLIALFPSFSNWQKALADPQARPSRGYLWVFITSFISIFFSILLYSFTARDLLPRIAAEFALYPELAALDPQAMFGSVLLGLIIASPILAALSILGVMIIAGLYQLVAKLLIGEGTFGEMAYALSAIYAPVALISLVTNLLTALLAPYGGAGLLAIQIVNVLIAVYFLYIQLAAIRGVNRFGWGASCGTFIAAPLLIGICFCVLSILLFGSGVTGLEGIEGLPVP